MEQHDWCFPHKPYDIRERLFGFVCAVVRLVRYLHTRGPIAIALSAQVLSSATSAGANYEEADDGSSKADTRAKRRIVLRELKETLFRLRVLRATEFLGKEHDPLIQECLELKLIVAKIIHNSKP